MLRRNWRKYQIQDIIHDLYDGPHATPKPSISGPVFLGIKNITEDNRLDLKEIRHIAREDFARWTKRVLPKENDLIFVYEATLGRYALIPKNLECCLGRRMALLRLDFSKVNPNFILYYFQSNEWEQIISRNTIIGATVNRIPLNQFSNFELKLPPLNIQNQIAKVLSDLDAKIEVNNKINAELEAMAKLIYDYWFVQFDFPFDFAQGKPDMNGKPYKSSSGKMVYNEELKREIPEGWGDGVLSDIAEITMGQSPPGSSYNEEGIGAVFYQGSTDFGSRFPKIRQYTTEPSRMAQEGDILLSVRAPVGTMNQAMENCCIGRGLAALREKEGSISYLWSQMVYFKQIFDRKNASGTTFGAITKNELFGLKVCIPKTEILEKFKEKVDPFHDKIVNNSKENQKLAELRDWLLPMLMNGQATVRSPEEVRDQDEAKEQVGMVAEENVKYGDV